MRATKPCLTRRDVVHPDREDLHEYQRAFAREDPARQLAEGLRGADVFLGASAGGVLSQEMAIGPLLMGTRLPAHLLQYGASVEEVVNLEAA